MDKNRLQELVDEGLSQRKIADLLKTSQGNVRYWLRKHEVKTNYQTRKAYTEDKEEFACHRHGLTTWAWQKSENKYRCLQCRADAVSSGRRALKAELVELLGGECVECGYSKSVWSLHFHHIDPENKKDSVSRFIQRRNRTAATEEALKCELVCANCHGEEEESRYWSSTNRTE